MRNSTRGRQHSLRGAWAPDRHPAEPTGYSATCRMWDGPIAAFKDRYKINRVGYACGHGRRGGGLHPTDPSDYFRGADAGRDHGRDHRPPAV